MNKSIELYERALKRIPWGTQTNAKRPDESLEGVQPWFIDRADGCRITDVDGNEFIDFRSALGPILIGYRNQEVDDAARTQLDKGVLFSMASPLEIEVAEKLCDMIPGLEKVRFLKTGSEVNNATLRLARVYTKRDRIVTCGYHGHADWFACGIGATPDWFPREGNGVPVALDELANRVDYGDIEGLEKIFEQHGDSIAALIIVPYDWNEVVAHEFVHRARELTSIHGTVLIFDQVLTGFRIAKAGAQEYFGVIPDLTTYAKAMANGYPLACFGGRAPIMDTLNDFLLTSTYAGETVSLAASLAVLEIIERDGVNEHIWEMGSRLMRGFDALASRCDSEARSFGLPPAPQFRLSNDDAAHDKLHTAFFRELYRNGVFPSRPFLISFAHKASDIDITLQAMESALHAALKEGAHV